ncbi:MAG: hypothetical protein IH840_03460 [Candidatus Heimdallarchaeota archaeon]|nr:hypothetical protein [Candidatus Heimdallarchaeota archaeon]
MKAHNEVIASKSYVKIDLNQVVDNLITLELSTLIDETGADISLQNQLPLIRGIPSQMRQLIQNLLSNGIKFVE